MGSGPSDEYHVDAQAAIEHAACRAGALVAASRFGGSDVQRKYKTEMRDGVPVVLGVGGMSQAVHLVTSRDSNCRRALKTISLRSSDGEMGRAVEAEVQASLTMDHPHIVRVFEVYQGDSAVHLVMEYLEGGEVFDRLYRSTDQRMSEREAARTLRQMFLAVAHVHARGVAHRDLKLENFLYDLPGSDHIKLVDFGVSQFAGEAWMRGGTTDFMAPEELAGQHGHLECDLWSMGVIAVNLLTGCNPFEDLRDRWSFTKSDCDVHGVPEEAADLLTSLLIAEEPKRRLSATQALQHPWMTQFHTKSEAVDTRFLRSLREFAQSSHFRRLGLALVGRELSRDDERSCRDIFSALDSAETGLVTVESFRHVLAVNWGIDEEESRRIFDALDVSGTQAFTFSDLMAAMCTTCIVPRQSAIDAAFRRLDGSDASEFDDAEKGSITADSLQSVFGNRFLPTEEVSLPNLQYSANIDLSLQEFAACIRGGTREAGRASTPPLGDGREEQLASLTPSFLEH